MWSGSRRGSDREHFQPEEVWSAESSGLASPANTSIAIHVLKRRIIGKQPARHFAHDPEEVAGPHLISLLRWWGIWPGDLSKVAQSPDELRAMLRELDLVWSEIGQYTSITKKVRPSSFCCFHVKKHWGAFRQLDSYLAELERRPRPHSVLAVVASDELVKLCLSLAGVHSLGAGASVNRRWKLLAESEEVWRSFLLAHWPASKWLPQSSANSKSSYARRVKLVRDAKQRDEEREYYETESGQDLTPEASKYALLFELVAGERLVMDGLVDLEYHNVSLHSPARLFGTVSARQLNKLPITKTELQEDTVYMSVSLMRKKDGKLLVIGDRLHTASSTADTLSFEMGSSPVTNNVDRMLDVLSKDMMMNFVLQNRDEHWFRHLVELTGVTWGPGGNLRSFTGIRLGMCGMPTSSHELRPAMVLSAWEHVAEWG